LNENMYYFLLGGGFGLFCAIVGALVDFLLMRRRGDDDTENPLPGCMLLMIGALGLMGLLSIGVSFLITGTIWSAIIVGTGVMLGFLIGFIILFLAAVFLFDRQVDLME
jgi:protein-S-isoprenylcysteine O-methyltransferase Ste14